MVVFVSTILITGPVASGKTTVAIEASAQLEAVGIAHALVDTDELDRIFPVPPDDPHKTALTERNLASVWENLRDAGAPRLILTMVATSLGHELPWIRTAVPGAEITVVRLRTSESTLLERVSRRSVRERPITPGARSSRLVRWRVRPRERELSSWRPPGGKWPISPRRCSLGAAGSLGFSWNF